MTQDTQDISTSMPKSSALETIAPYQAKIDAAMSEVLCVNARDMIKARPESGLGDFLADACLSVARDSSGMDIDGALFNTGGIRSAVAAGEITIGDIYQLMPFDNELVVIELPYVELMELINYIANKGGEPVSDIRLTITENGFSDASIGGQPIEERNYRILTSDYLATGGDKMVFFTEGHRLSKTSLGIKVRDALIYQCRAFGDSGITLDYDIDGRITAE